MWPGQLEILSVSHFETWPMSQMQRDLHLPSVSYFLKKKKKGCLPKVYYWIILTKVFFRKPTYGKFAILVVVISGVIISYLIWIQAILTIVIINHFGYWNFPQALLESPILLKFLNVFLKIVYSDLALLNENLA